MMVHFWLSKIPEFDQSASINHANQRESVGTQVINKIHPCNRKATGKNISPDLNAILFSVSVLSVMYTI
jgi:hypothetical protein